MFSEPEVDTADILFGDQAGPTQQDITDSDSEPVMSEISSNLEDSFESGLENQMGLYHPYTERDPFEHITMAHVEEMASNFIWPGTNLREESGMSTFYQ